MWKKIVENIKGFEKKSDFCENFLQIDYRECDSLRPQLSFSLSAGWPGVYGPQLSSSLGPSS